jgi:hypothetical protein
MNHREVRARPQAAEYRVLREFNGTYQKKSAKSMLMASPPAL